VSMGQRGRARLDGPRVDLNRVRLTLVKVDDRWLVNKVVAL